MCNSNGDNDKKYHLTGMAVSPSEAAYLFLYHLDIAAKLFEAMPENFKISQGRFDDFSKNAAEAFLQAMTEAYNEAERHDDPEE